MSMLDDELNKKGRKVTISGTKHTRGKALRHAFGASQKSAKRARRDEEVSIHPEQTKGNDEVIDTEENIQRGLQASPAIRQVQNQQQGHSGRSLASIDERAEQQVEEEKHAQRVAQGTHLANTASKETTQLLEESDLPKYIKDQSKENARRGNFEKGLSQGPLMSKFTEGMAAYLPMIVAASFQGARGIQATTGITNTLLKQQSGGGSGKTDITPDFAMKGTGEPVFTKEINGQPAFINSKGETIDPSMVESLRAVESRVRNKTVTTRHKQRLAEGKASRTESFLGKFRKEQEKTKSQIDSSSNLISILESGQPISSDQIGTFNARALFDEVGRLSDDDVRRAKVPLNMWKRYKNDVSEMFSGSATAEVRKIAGGLLKFVSKGKRAKLLRDAQSQATSGRAGRLGFETKEKLLEEMQADLGIDFNEKKVEADVPQEDLEVRNVKGKRAIFNRKTKAFIRWQ